jgi:hypothetical protein
MTGKESQQAGEAILPEIKRQGHLSQTGPGTAEETSRPTIRQKALEARYDL